MSQRESIALNRLDSGFDCARAVISAFLPALPVSPEQSRNFSEPSCCLLGKPQEQCGVVTGAIQVIRMKTEGSPAEKETADRLIVEFEEAFRKHHGSLRCSDLLGADLGTYRGLFSAMDNDSCEKMCNSLVSDAVTLLEEELHLS